MESCLLHGINRSLYVPRDGAKLEELRQCRDMFAKEIARAVVAGRVPPAETVSAFSAYDGAVKFKTG